MTKSDRIDALRGKSITITHRVELIDQSAHVVTPPGRIKWPEGTIVTVDHAESPVKRWSMCGDARVRPEHRNINRDYGKMAATPDPWRDGVGYSPAPDLGLYDCAGRYRVPYVQMMGRGLRAFPGYASGINGDRQYQVALFGKKFRTRVYVRGMWIKTMYSKRRKTAIAKGEEWIARNDA